MSSYNRTVWQDSPETEITAERLNNMEEGIEQAHNGENIPNFANSDALDTEEAPLEWMDVEILTNGERLSSIISKVSAMFRNVRYLYEKVKELLPNKVTGKYITATDGILRDAKMRVIVGTKLLTATNKDYANLFTLKEMAELLGVEESKINTTRIFISAYNGDGGANGIHITSIDWWGGDYNIWYAYFSGTLSMQMRANYMITYAEVGDS